jgi:hypothetical protein
MAGLTDCSKPGYSQLAIRKRADTPHHLRGVYHTIHVFATSTSRELNEWKQLVVYPFKEFFEVHFGRNKIPDICSERLYFILLSLLQIFYRFSEIDYILVNKRGRFG